MRAWGFGAIAVVLLLLAGCANAAPVVEEVKVPADQSEAVTDVAEQLEEGSDEISVQTSTDPTCTSLWEGATLDGTPAPNIGAVTASKEGEGTIVHVEAGDHRAVIGQYNKLAYCFSSGSPDGDAVSWGERFVDDLWAYDQGILELDFSRDLREYGTDQFSLTVWYQDVDSSNMYHHSDMSAPVAVTAP